MTDMKDEDEDGADAEEQRGFWAAVCESGSHLCAVSVAYKSVCLVRKQVSTVSNYNCSVG